MGVMCVAFGHRFEVQPLSGNRRWCIRCGTREAIPQDVAEAEVEYASRVSGITPPLEGVTEEEFTRARRDSIEDTVRHVTERESANQVASMLWRAEGTQPGLQVPDYTPPYFKEVMDTTFRRLRALLADRNATISKLRSKNERLWRRQRRLHEEIKELQGMLEVERAPTLDEIEEAANLAGPKHKPVGAIAIARSLGLELPGIKDDRDERASGLDPGLIGRTA